jgi:nitrite reductase (NADH) small subunit
MPRVRVCSTLDLPPFGGRLFEEAGGTERDVLIFKLPGGALRAWDAECPHAGAQLHPRNEMGGELVCFLHQWAFDIATGDCRTAPDCRLTTYEIEVEGADVWVTVADNPPRPKVTRQTRSSTNDTP